MFRSPIVTTDIFRVATMQPADKVNLIVSLPRHDLLEESLVFADGGSVLE